MEGRQLAVKGMMGRKTARAAQVISKGGICWGICACYVVSNGGLVPLTGVIR